MFHCVTTTKCHIFKKRALLASKRGSIFASLLGCLLCLYACASTPVTTNKTISHHATPTPPSPPKGTVLFQSDWSQPQPLWHLQAGWQQTNDYLQSDVNANLLLTIPYTPTTPNYTVEFHLQVVNVPHNGGYFQLSSTKNAYEDGYKAYVSPLLDARDHLSWVHPDIAVVINPLDNMDGAPQIHDYDPTSKWRIYQVTVMGAHVNFSVDNFRISYAVITNTHTLSRGPLQFTCSGSVLRLGKIRIIAE